MRWLLASLFIVVALILPSAASADNGRQDEGVIMRITGDVTIAKDQTVGSVIVIDGNVTVDGTVKDSLTVIDGTAVINGTVRGELTVISGTLDLRSGAQVEDLNLISSDLLRADGVVVSGEITDRDGVEIPAGFIAALSIYFWVAMTLAVVAAGLTFAAIGGRQLNEASRVFLGEPMNAFVGSVFVWVAAPVLAVAAMITLIGLPLGIGIMLFVLPALWFLGYIVAGARLGKLILQRDDNPGHPLAATTLGLVLLQLFIIVPVVGALVAMAAGAWGAGTLAYLAYRAAGGKGFSTSTPAPVGSAPTLAT